MKVSYAVFFPSEKKKYPGVLEIESIIFRLCWNANHSEEIANKLKTKFTCDTRLPSTCDRGKKSLTLKGPMETNEQSSPSLESLQKLHLTILKSSIVFINSII